MPANRERMSAVDAAWLQMDTPENRMIITSLMQLDGPAEPALLEASLQKFAAHARFHQRVVPAANPLSLPYWEEDPRFDFRAHLHHVTLPDEAAMERFVGERMSAGLSREKPLWEMDVIDRPGEGTALLLRVHHCVGDGVALTRILLDMSEAATRPPKVVGRAPPPPRRPLQWLGFQAAQLWTLVELLALPADPQTPLRAPLGLVKTAAWSRPIPVELVEAQARACGASVNDVLMAALAGALRATLEPAALREVHALVPLYLRGAEGTAGNNFGLVFVKLPLLQETREDRVHKLRKRAGIAKASPTAPLAFTILRSFGAAGAALERIGVSIFTAKSSVMV
ncbi:MAG TPA: wax ester/triacylglycerol synthase domain-containing protein, partial [Myxococcales bacterium]|nr:wax ester/triacylglycerol synthase domain-containing protein [Myxococcales bacterium]